MNKQPIRWFAGLAPVFLASTLAAAPFDLLFRVMHPTGPCEVRRAGAADYEPAQKGKAYPYGTRFRCGEGGSALIVLSEKDAIQVEPNTTIELLNPPAEGDAGKVLRLVGGSLKTRMDMGNDPYALILETPVARAVSLAGNGLFKLTETEAGLTLAVQAEGSGTIRLVGPQFIIPVLKNGFGVRILTARDLSLTRIENLLGDYRVYINTGMQDDAPETVDGEVNTELIAVDTSSRSAVKIWRTHAKVGGRLIVSVLATDASGKGRENFAFAVGQPSIASRAIFEEDVVTNAIPELPEGEAETGAADTPTPDAAPAAIDFDAFQ